MNTLKKEREQRLPDDKYPWLDPDDECRHMTEIFQKSTLTWTIYVQLKKKRKKL